MWELFLIVINVKVLFHNPPGLKTQVMENRKENKERNIMEKKQLL